MRSKHQSSCPELELWSNGGFFFWHPPPPTHPHTNRATHRWNDPEFCLAWPGPSSPEQHKQTIHPKQHEQAKWQRTTASQKKTHTKVISARWLTKLTGHELSIDENSTDLMAKDFSAAGITSGIGNHRFLLPWTWKQQHQKKKKKKKTDQRKFSVLTRLAKPGISSKSWEKTRG